MRRSPEPLDVQTWPRPPIEEILTLAGRAPSIHNTQPWRWRVGPDRVELYGDLTRLLPVEDPDGRALVLSCGALLQHVQVVAAALGWPARVHRLPDPGNPWHLANVVLIRRSGVLGGDDLDVVRRRQTDRRRYTSWPVPEARLNRLAAEGALWGAQVFPVNSLALRRELLALAAEAERVQDSDPRVREEVARWWDGAGDGVPASHVPDDLPRPGPTERGLHRFVAGTLPDPRPEPDTTVGGLLLVCTWADDAAAWLRAGEALSAIWLRATREGLAVLPLSQVVEVEATRTVLRDDVLNGLAEPQLLLRIGWPALAGEPLTPSPRRPLADLLLE